jgi:hypothetical protein
MTLNLINLLINMDTDTDTDTDTELAKFNQLGITI